MNHQPLLVWAGATMLLASLLLGPLDVPGVPTPDAPAETAAAVDSAHMLARLVSPPPLGRESGEFRAWLESVREIALEGAERAVSAGEADAAPLWSEVLRLTSAALAEDVSPAERMRARSRVTSAVYALEAHYRRG